jgi:hypothetical protein
MGWLYVAAGMAIPCAVDCFWHKLFTVSTISVAAGGLGCILLVMAGMTEKAKDPKWEPSPTLHWVAGLLALFLLIQGYQVHDGLVSAEQNGKVAAVEVTGGGR